MLDHRLRPLKDSLLGPVAARLAGRVSPNVVTALALAAGLAAAWAALRGAAGLALGLWIANRLLDGLDGSIARASGHTSDLGGYLDLVTDFVVYAALPFGIALGLAPGVITSMPLDGAASSITDLVDTVIAVGARDARTALAVLLAALYVNAAAWLTLSAILEKRGAARASGDQSALGATPLTTATTIQMPKGVIGGAETAALYAAMLAWPQESIAIMWLMSVLVAISALQRVIWAARTLSETG